MVQLNEIFNRQKAVSSNLRTEPISNRKERLRSIRSWILANRTALQQAMLADLGKPPAETDVIEIFSVLNEIKFTLSNLDRWTKPKKIDAPLELLGTTSWIQYEPRGVCLIISPWNYPFTLCIGPLVSALAAGNTAILKPSELSPNVSAEISRMIRETMDPSIVSVVEGDAEIAKALLALPFDHIFFTGSPAVGKLVMKAAAENLASVTLELGGKSPVIVTDSAIIKDAAKRIAVVKFVNNGQTCIAPDYVLVHEKISRPFIDELIKQTKTSFTENGEPFKNSKHYGRIVNERHHQRLNDLLQDALKQGAKTELIGTPAEADNKFMHPTIITDVPPDSRVMQEEIFGPLLPVISFKTIEEAMEIVKARPKPLALYIFSRKKKEYSKILQQTSAGAVCINDCGVHFFHHNLPFGGVNNSGIGQSHGYAGFLSFSHEKPVLRQMNRFSGFSVFYPPYTAKVRWLVNWLLKLFSY